MNKKNDTLASDVQVRVDHALDKNPSGELIILDYNAFHAAESITDPQLKDIAARVLPDLRYEDIKPAFMEVVKAKRAEMLAFAKTKVKARMVPACVKLGVTLTNGMSVSSFDLLREYFKEANSTEQQEIIAQITIEPFKINDIWKDDISHDTLEFFGIAYDPISVTKGKNNKGCGFASKIVTKALCNLRNDLRMAGIRANPYSAVSPARIKRSREESYSSGKYRRKKSCNKRTKELDELMEASDVELDYEQGGSDSDSEIETKQVESKVSSEKYLLLKRQLAGMRVALALSRKREGDALKTLKLVRLSQDERKDEVDMTSASSAKAIVKKHGCKIKKGISKCVEREQPKTPEDSEASESESSLERQQPSTSKGKTVKITATKVSSKMTKGEKEMQKMLMEKSEPESSSDSDSTESCHTPKGDIEMENVVEEIETEKLVAPKCNHDSLVDFVKEDNHLYCEVGQKFHEAICFKCGGTFVGKAKPTKNKPIYYCPRFEEEGNDGVECTCVYCHGCYCKQTKDAPRARRGNRAK